MACLNFFQYQSDPRRRPWKDKKLTWLHQSGPLADEKDQSCLSYPPFLWHLIKKGQKNYL